MGSTLIGSSNYPDLSWLSPILAICHYIRRYAIWDILMVNQIFIALTDLALHKYPGARGSTGIPIVPNTLSHLDSYAVCGIGRTLGK